MPYHHGDLRQGLLDAAIRLVEREGLGALTLREVAREAGVSHAAPRNHFVNLETLLSELAAVGFRHLREAMEGAAAAEVGEGQRMTALGRAYVQFAIDRPRLFSFLFRPERQDLANPNLRAAARALIDLLTASKASATPGEAPLTAAQARRSALAWSQVHGLALLSIDGRLDGIAGRVSSGMSGAELLRLVLEQ